MAEGDLDGLILTGETDLRDGLADGLGDFDGVWISGSPHNVYALDQPSVREQVALARISFDFEVAGKRLPAGNYEVSRQGGKSFLHFRDRATGKITYGRVPSGSVVVPGSLPSADGSHSLACAVIVKRVDAQTRSKTGINELLRD